VSDNVEKCFETDKWMGKKQESSNAPLSNLPNSNINPYWGDYFIYFLNKSRFPNIKAIGSFETSETDCPVTYCHIS